MKNLLSQTTVDEVVTRRFIVLDGPDGSGKTVQLGLLAKSLRECGYDVVEAVDPGGTKIGDQISRLLKYDAQGLMDVNTEVMLFMASRAQLVRELVEPALEAGKVVLCDRFVSATCAYQGSGGYPTDKIIELGRTAVGDIWPALTIVIDVPAEEGLERAGRKKYQKTKVNHRDADQGYLFDNAVVDRFDSRPLDYHRKVRREFLRLPKYYPGNVEIVNGSKRDIAAVHLDVKRLALATLS